MGILRSWRGATASERADEYVGYLLDTGVAELSSTPGNRGVLVLRRPRGELTDFTVASLWGSMDEVRGFAGEEPGRAVFYPADEEFLVERGATVEHHEVAVRRGLRAPVVDHVSVPVAELAATRRFYDAALAPLGLRVVSETEGAIAYGRPRLDELWLHEGTPVPGLHVALAAPSQEAVRAFHAAALSAGARDNGGPGLRPHHHVDYYAAFVLDPNGVNLEAVFHGRRGGTI